MEIKLNEIAAPFKRCSNYLLVMDECESFKQLKQQRLNVWQRESDASVGDNAFQFERTHFEHQTQLILLQ